MAQYGVLNEVGDLGLGFDPLTPEEQKVVQESQQPATDKKEKESGD